MMVDPHILTMFRFKCNPNKVKSGFKHCTKAFYLHGTLLSTAERHVKVNNFSTWVVENENNTDILVVDIGHAFEDVDKVAINLNDIGDIDTDYQHDATNQDKIMLKNYGEERLKECRRNDTGVRRNKHRKGKKTS